MKFFKNMLLIVALSLVVSVFPRSSSTPTPQDLKPVYLTAQQIEAKKQAAATKAAQEKKLAETGQQTTSVNEGDALVQKLLTYSVPWPQNSEVQKMYDDNKDKLSKEQHDYLLSEYGKRDTTRKQKEEADKLAGMLQPKGQGASSTEQVGGPSLTFEDVKSGAYERAKSLLSMGGQKLQSTWEGIKGMGSRAWEGTLGEYGSSMGGYKYLLPGALILSMPGALVGGAGLAATTLWGIGGSAAVLGVTGALDRLNHAYETGGYMSTAAYIDDVKKAMALELNDQAAYPYYVSKIEALTLRNELYPLSKDKFGVAEKAHAVLLSEAQSAPKDQNKEKAFSNEIAAIRVQNGYDSATNAQYISKLEQGDALIKAQALVSEHSRAKHRKKVEELTKKDAEAKKAAEDKAVQKLSPISQPTVQSKGTPVATSSAK